jgi:hypothetical protein
MKMSKSKKTKKRKSNNIAGMPVRRYLPEHIEKGPNDTLSSVRGTLDTAIELSHTQEDMTMDWFKEKEVDIEKFEPVYNEFIAYNTAREANGVEVSDEEYITFLTGLYSKFATEATDSHIEEFESEETGNVQSKMVAEFVTKACENWKSILDTRQQMEDLEKEYNELRTAEADRLTSKEYDDEKVARIDKLQADVDALVSDNGLSSVIARKKREIRLIKERFTVNYLYDRIDDETIGAKEKKTIVEAFFSDHISAYVTQRFKDRCKSCHLDISILNHLINLEENYLPEEYAVYNNFYLFFIMRATGHTDKKDINEIKQVFRNMINLVYNKFYDDETKQLFIDSMKGFLDRFSEYRELFSEKNILQPNHPYRIKKDAEISAMKRSKYLKVIETDYPEEVDTQEKKDKIDAMTNAELVEFIKSLEQAKADKEQMEEAIEKAEADIVKTADEKTLEALGEAIHNSTVAVDADNEVTDDQEITEGTDQVQADDVETAEEASVGRGNTETMMTVADYGEVEDETTETSDETLEDEPEESSDILYVQTDPSGTEVVNASRITLVPPEKVSDEEPAVEVEWNNLVDSTKTPDSTDAEESSIEE